ncbi:MAG TPA: GUN4 domain-containing protein [Allocoleopsis sp.]
MTEKSPEPKSPLSEQIADAVIKVLFAGSGLSGLWLLFQNEILKALIACLFSAMFGLVSSFGDGLMEILKTRMKERGQGVGKAIDRAVDLTLSGFKQKYLDVLKVECYTLEVEGHQLTQALALEDVFVPLHIESSQNPGMLSESNQEIWEFLPNKHHSPGQYPHRRIIILAGPGYGKTTLLRYLTFTYVTKSHPSQARWFIPVLLRLREIHTLIQGKNSPSLSELIIKHLENRPEYRDFKPSQHWIEKWLDDGDCLVMLDGLDEVPKTQRDKVREWTDGEMKAYPKTQFILTSRPHGYELRPDEPNTPVQTDLKLKVLDFTPDQKQQLIDKWYRALIVRKWRPLREENRQKPESSRLSEEEVEAKIEREAKDYADDLAKQIFSSPALNDLARNPLLITMIATTHRVQTVLPKRRVELYDTMCGLLLGTRPYTKKTNLTLSATENKAVLQVLAWQLVQQEKTQFTPEQGEQWIQDILVRCRKDRDLSPKQFWEEMLDIAGLLLEKEAGIYEFSHQTFQEYLAALQIKERGEEALLLEKLSNDRWQEVICFYAALGSATNLINAALDNPTSYTLKLANRCKNEGRDVDPQTLTRLETILTELPFTVGVVAEIRLDQRFRRNLIPIDDCTAIDQGYITCGEYQLFLDAQSTGQFHSQAKLVPIDSRLVNKPVSGITWEDARWFCAWLGTLAHLYTTYDDEVYDYRLPNEEELRQFPANEQEQLVAWTEPPTNQGNTLRVVRVKLPTRYKALLNYLANGRWREADEETGNLLLEVTGRKDRGYLNPEDIEKFPCEDLRIINQLWVKFSGGKFGFSVQKQIYVETGNKLDRQFYKQEFEIYGDYVGWRKKEKWLEYAELNFSLTAKKGHLPAIPLMMEGVCFGGWLLVCVVGGSSLFSRIEACKV